MYIYVWSETLMLLDAQPSDPHQAVVDDELLLCRPHQVDGAPRRFAGCCGKFSHCINVPCVPVEMYKMAYKLVSLAECHQLVMCRFVT